MKVIILGFLWVVNMMTLGVKQRSTIKTCWFLSDTFWTPRFLNRSQLWILNGRESLGLDVMSCTPRFCSFFFLMPPILMCKIPLDVANFEATPCFLEDVYMKSYMIYDYIYIWYYIYIYIYIQYLYILQFLHFGFSNTTIYRGSPQKQSHGLVDFSLEHLCLKFLVQSRR